MPRKLRPFQKQLLECKKIAEKNKAQLEKDCEAACRLLMKKTGRSILLYVADKGGSSIFGQKYDACGFTANSDDSLDEIDEKLKELIMHIRTEVSKIK